MNVTTKMAMRGATKGMAALNKLNDTKPRTAVPEKQGEAALALMSKALKIPVCSYPQGNVGAWPQRQGSRVPGCPTTSWEISLLLERGSWAQPLNP